jgi:two-component system, NtrC family, nitrogen regulation response regulator NtrX
MALEILIVDDETDIRQLISGILQDEGYQTREAANSDETIARIAERRPALIILDIWLRNSKLDGLEILDLIQATQPVIPIVIISGHGNVETAVAAIKRGAYDFIEKPFQADHLLHVVQRATEANRMRRENDELRERADIEHEFTGDSATIINVGTSVRKVASTGSRVLITGPAGSGKELAARMLHACSPRSSFPFVVVSGASMVPDRLELELFGIERDNNVIKTGLLEQAHGGTLFLDEVADMPATTQAKILRVLTDQQFQRVDGNSVVKVDVRVVSATSRDLKTEIEQGRFREDLFYRLNVVPIRIPSLLERREDIPALVDHMIRRLSLARGRRPLSISDEALAALQAYEWPGNVRQLRNIVERTLILAPEDDSREISLAMLPPELSVPPARMFGEGATAVMSVPLREAREAFEREYLKVQLRRFSGNISRTAGFIGMERSALHRKMRTLGLSESERDAELDENGHASVTPE